MNHSKRSEETWRLRIPLQRHGYIPKSFIIDYYSASYPKEAESSEAVELKKALGTLKAISLITAPADDTIDLHRLVQFVTRKWLFNKKRIANFALEALRIMSNKYPYGRFETRDLCAKYLPHARAVLKKELISNESNLARASLCRCMGCYLDTQGWWKEAEELGIQVIEICKRVLGEEHPETLTNMANLART